MLRRMYPVQKYLLRKIEESEDITIQEINHCRIIIKNTVDQHHDELIDQVKSINERFTDTFKEAEGLFEKCKKKLEDKVNFLSNVCQSRNYSLMLETPIYVNKLKVICRKFIPNYLKSDKMFWEQYL